MLRKIVQRLFLIITQPAKTWDLLVEEDKETERFLSNYLYPIFGIITLAAFLGSFFAQKSLEVALKFSIKEVVTCFAGFYLASFLLKELMMKKFAYANVKRHRQFVAYASSLIYVVSFAVSLCGFHLLYLLLPYTIYMIWEGVIPYMKIKEDDQVKFTVLSSVIVFVPYLISFIINQFMLIAPHATT